jgi:hypothetical protein
VSRLQELGLLVLLQPGMLLLLLPLLLPLVLLLEVLLPLLPPLPLLLLLLLELVHVVHAPAGVGRPPQPHSGAAAPAAVVLPSCNARPVALHRAALVQAPPAAPVELPRHWQCEALRCCWQAL